MRENLNLDGVQESEMSLKKSQKPLAQSATDSKPTDKAPLKCSLGPQDPS
jgi:hypothetical protein